MKSNLFTRVDSDSESLAKAFLPKLSGVRALLLALGAAFAPVARAAGSAESGATVEPSIQNVWSAMRSKRNGGDSGTFPSEQLSADAAAQNERIALSAQQGSEQLLAALVKQSASQLAAENRAIDYAQHNRLTKAEARFEERLRQSRQRFDQRIHDLEQRARRFQEDESGAAPQQPAASADERNRERQSSLDSKEGFKAAAEQPAAAIDDSGPRRAPAGAGQAALIVEGVQQGLNCWQGLLDDKESDLAEPVRKGCHDAKTWLNGDPAKAKEVPFGGYRDAGGRSVTHDQFYAEQNPDPNFIGPPAPLHDKGRPIESAPKEQSVEIPLGPPE